jgi:hypothetical protein
MAFKSVSRIAFTRQRSFNSWSGKSVRVCGRSQVDDPAGDARAGLSQAEGVNDHRVIEDAVGAVGHCQTID